MENSNKPAFSGDAFISDITGHKESVGLTKREYFAAFAMQGLLSSGSVMGILSGNNGMAVPNLIAEYSVQYADALLAELDKPKGGGQGC